MEGVQHMVSSFRKAETPPRDTKESTTPFVGSCHQMNLTGLD